jgi:uroporphyrinogen-III synthase
VMFVSPNAVDAFFAQRPPSNGRPMAWPEGTLAATVGPGSAAALAAQGVPAALIVQPPADAPSLDSEHLWPELQRMVGADWHDASVLLVRGDGGREWLGDRLREAGAQVGAISVYRRRCPTLDARGQSLLRTALGQPDRHVWLFSSAEAIGHLEALTAGLASAPSEAVSPESGTQPEASQPLIDAVMPRWAAVRAIATHERIAARARSLGLLHVVLVRPDAPAVASAFRGLSGATLESPS